MQIKNKEKTLKFPDGFLWGTATSAYQIEGGIKNDWSEWEKSPQRIEKLKKQGKNPRDYICGQACDSYNRYKEDFDLAVMLNTNAIRFGIEWSRIEPKEGMWNAGAVKHYRKVMEAAKARNLKVVLTLWHWTNPIWIAKQGGWTNPKTADYYLRYVDVMIKELGTYVDYWVTLNEPNAYVGFSYLAGIHPPGKKLDLGATHKVFSNLSKANSRCYDLIHEHFSNTFTGITVLANYNMPAHNWCPAERLYAKIANYFAIYMFLNKISDSMDFIGLNSYKMNRVVWFPPFKRNKNKLVNEMGWAVYPKGIYQVLKKLSRYNLPILITENGTADEKDGHRSMFIKENLRYIHKAIHEGVDVRGYFHWSLLDNFEWAKGWKPKFGLYAVDRGTFKRTPRPSAKVYAHICRSNEVNLGAK